MKKNYNLGTCFLIQTVKTDQAAERQRLVLVYVVGRYGFSCIVRMIEEHDKWS